VPRIEVTRVPSNPTFVEGSVIELPSHDLVETSRGKT
jgi:hypothetical protein